MSLDWNIKAVRDHEELYEGSEEDGYELQTVPHLIVMLTMIIGVPHINDATLDLFYKRVRIYETCFGSFLYHEVEGKTLERPVYIEDVERLKGLKTNASTKTRAKFKDEIYLRLEEQADRALAQARRSNDDE